MPTLVRTPSVVTAAGNVPKRIEEFVGRVNTGTNAVSMAKVSAGEAYAGIKDAALAASIFHFGVYTVEDTQKYLRDKDIPVRL